MTKAKFKIFGFITKPRKIDDANLAPRQLHAHARWLKEQPFSISLWLNLLNALLPDAPARSRSICTGLDSHSNKLRAFRRLLWITPSLIHASRLISYTRKWHTRPYLKSDVNRNNMYISTRVYLMFYSYQWYRKNCLIKKKSSVEKDTQGIINTFALWTGYFGIESLAKNDFFFSKVVLCDIKHSWSTK